MNDGGVGVGVGVGALQLGSEATSSAEFDDLFVLLVLKLVATIDSPMGLNADCVTNMSASTTYQSESISDSPGPPV